MKLSRGFLITVILILGAPIAFIFISPMGTGNNSNCRALKNDLLTMTEMELKDKYHNSLNVLTFDDGIVFGICEDSHSSFFGGNMVVKIDASNVLTYMGHVCGTRYLSMFESSYVSSSKRDNVPVNKIGFSEYLKEELSIVP
jgi:hypothetical protein